MPLHPTTLRRRAAQQEEEQEEGESWLVKLGYKAGEEDKTRSLKERLKSGMRRRLSVWMHSGGGAGRFNPCIAPR